MKKILLIIVLGLTCGAFTNCTDMTTDLTLDTNTRFISLVNPYPSAAYQYAHTWVAGQESHTMLVAVSCAGLPLDIPVKFKFEQSNFPAEGASETTKLTFGEYGVTYELEESYELPAGEKAVLVPIKFKKDPNRVNVGPGQLYSMGWITILDFIILNEEELTEHDCRFVRTNTKIYAKEMSVRL